MRKLTLLLIIFFSLLNCNVFSLKNIQKWKDGVIPYTFHKSVPKEYRVIIERAMEEWEKKTKVVVFIKGDKDSLDTYDIYFIETKEHKERKILSSTVGYTPYFNHMKIYNGLTFSVVLHELGHCLGLRHEHQRPDRDKYVKIIYKNIIKGAEDNFNIMNENDYLYPYKKFPYDYLSIMHYQENTLSKKYELNTIESKRKIGGDRISPIDIKKIKYIYGGN